MMKNHKRKATLLSLLTASLLAFSSCEEYTPPEALMGHWVITNHECTGNPTGLTFDMDHLVVENACKHLSPIPKDNSEFTYKMVNDSTILLSSEDYYYDGEEIVDVSTTVNLVFHISPDGKTLDLYYDGSLLHHSWSLTFTSR